VTVFLTETECVYCAVCSAYTVYVSINKEVWLLRGTFCRNNVFVSHYFTVQQQVTGFYNWKEMCLLLGTFCPHSVIMCYAWSWEQTAIVSLYSIDCFYNPDGVCLLRCTFCPHSVLLCFYNRSGVFTARYILPKQCIYERLFHCTSLSDWFL
jgi:hypothetical protein